MGTPAFNFFLGGVVLTSFFIGWRAHKLRPYQQIALAIVVGSVSGALAHLLFGAV